MMQNITSDSSIAEQVKVEVVVNEATGSGNNEPDGATFTETELFGQTKEAGEANLGKTETFAGVNQTGEDESSNRMDAFNNSSRLAKTIKNESLEQDNIQNFAQTEITHTEVNSVGDVVEVVTRYATVDSESVLSQITESIKVNVSQDVTTMEMQLHPASLGTVHMQISSNNGVVTAQLLVQDEAVKAAIEGQLLSLQETLEQQGHKVEAVEVSVASYDLNKGSNQNDGREGGEKDKKDSFTVRGARRRNLNLGDLPLDEDEEELTDADKITKDMMEKNGNTVDYTV